MKGLEGWASLGLSIKVREGQASSGPANRSERFRGYGPRPGLPTPSLANLQMTVQIPGLGFADERERVWTRSRPG